MIGYAEQQPNNRVKMVKVFDEHNRELFTVYGLLISYDEKSVSIEKDCEIEKYDEKGNLISENKSNICNIENDSKLDVKEDSKEDNSSELTVSEDNNSRTEKQYNKQFEKKNQLNEIIIPIGKNFYNFLYSIGRFFSKESGCFLLVLLLFGIYLFGAYYIGFDLNVIPWLILFPIGVIFVIVLTREALFPIILFFFIVFLYPIIYYNCFYKSYLEIGYGGIIAIIFFLSWFLIIPYSFECLKEVLEKERERKRIMNEEAEERKRIREEKEREERERQRYIAEHTSKDSVCEYCGSNWLGEGCKHSPDGYHHHRKIITQTKIVEKEVPRTVERIVEKVVEKERPKEKVIESCTQRGDRIYAYDEKGSCLFSKAGELKGWTSSSVSVLRGNRLYTYDVKGTSKGSRPWS